MKLGDLLTNKYVLYIILIVAISNIIGYIAIGDEESLVFFITIGLLSTFFSNNMIVVLLIAIFSTNILFAGNVVHEGLETIRYKNRETKKGGGKKGKRGEKGEKVKEETFTQKNIPSSQPAPATEEEEDEAIGKRIDFASTLEQAYDNLQQMLGPDGINGLSNETKNLVSQQKNLMQNLNDMAPVLKTAKTTLENLSGNMPNMENLQGLMKNFGGGFSGLTNSIKK